MQAVSGRFQSQNRGGSSTLLMGSFRNLSEMFRLNCIRLTFHLVYTDMDRGVILGEAKEYN